APRIIEYLYLNRNTRMSTADRLVELAVRNRIELTGLPAWKEAQAAIMQELIAEPTAEPSPQDIAFRETQELAERLESQDAEEDTHVETPEGKEELRKKYLPLYQRVAAMTVSEQLRAAPLGSREERPPLVRDT